MTQAHVVSHEPRDKEESVNEKVEELVKQEVKKTFNPEFLNRLDEVILFQALTDADLMQLRDVLVEQVGRYRSRGVIVDVTALDVMDSFATRMIRDIAHMIRLRGAETVIVGIQPEVAFSMVQLGLTLEEVSTRLDFEEGIAYLNSKKSVSTKIGSTPRRNR